MIALARSSAARLAPAIRAFAASSPPAPEQLYLHVAPDGDSWTGPTIFAAKHLPADFVVSVKVPAGFDPDALTEQQLQEIYDSKALPAAVLSKPQAS